MLVVRTAEQPDPVRPVDTCPRESVAVIEFQGAGLGASSAVRVGEGSSAMMGIRRAARARLIRLYAASSEKPSSPTQKANIEGNGRSR